MSCESCRELLLDLLLGELDERTAGDTSAHVGECPACAVAYARLHLDLAGLAPACEAEPSEHARTELRARIERNFASPRARALSWMRRPVPAYGLLAAAMLPLVVWTLAALGEREDAGRSKPPTVATDRDPATPAWDASASTIDPHLM
jgi:anti-sigma factor RsiW